MEENQTILNEEQRNVDPEPRTEWFRVLTSQVTKRKWKAVGGCLSQSTRLKNEHYHIECCLPALEQRE